MPVLCVPQNHSQFTLDNDEPRREKLSAWRNYIQERKF